MNNFDFVATHNFTSSHAPWVMYLAYLAEILLYYLLDPADLTFPHNTMYYFSRYNLMIYHPFFSFLDLNFAKPLCVIKLQHNKKRTPKNSEVG